MDIDRMANHLVGWNTLPLIFNMRYARVRQVVAGIQLSSCHWGIGRIDHNKPVSHLLDEPMGMYHIRLFLDMAEILCLRALVLQTLLIAVEHDVVRFWSIAFGDVDSLGDVVHFADGETVSSPPRQLQNGLLAHAVDDDVSRCIAKNTGTQLVLPVVVVGKSPQ